jgi:predicted ATPase
MREKQLLLMLDNFEHLLPAAPVVAELLGAGRGLKVLVTSRTVLRLYGEHDYPVPPLELPARLPLPPLERLTQSEAVRLMLQGDSQRAAALFEEGLARF